MKPTSLLLTCLIGLAVPGVGLAQPTITAHPRSTTVNAGAAANFSVSATSSSPMTYEWRFRDEVIPNAATNLLRIENAGLTNLGAYTVRVTDSAGSVESQAATLSLNVTVSPNF